MSKRSPLAIEPSEEAPHTRANATPIQSIPIIQDTEPEGSSVPLSHYLWILRRHVWKMVAFVVVCVLATFVVSARLKPIFESTATIDVDLKAPLGVVGQDSTAPAVPGNPDVFLATQLKLIQSDAVLRPVAEQYHLLPGSHSDSSPEDTQRVTGSVVSLSGLRVTRPSNTYLLLISYRSADPRVAADVANAVATSYLAHTYDIRIRSSASLSSFMEKQMDELKANMERSSMALSKFEKDIEVVNPDAKTNILSARLLQLNTEYTAAQAARIHEEAAWNSMQSGSLEAAEISSQGESLTKLADNLNEARQNLAEVQAVYGSNHPEYRKASTQLTEAEKEFDDTRRNISSRIGMAYKQSQSREQMLQNAVAETKDEWDRINTRTFEYQQLKQEADADRSLYDELIKKIHETGINVGFQDNNIRIADVARPSAIAVFPDTKLNLLMAFLFSSLLAGGAAILLDSLDTTLRDPEEASRFLGTDVIGTLPLDKNVSVLPKIVRPDSGFIPMDPSTSNGNGHGGSGKNYYRSISGFEEAVRTIRNTILLSDFEHRLRSIMLTSAEPREGKTTLAVYLAIANADRGKKTLLVDGDLRRPSLHTRFGVPLKEGLSNVLTGAMSWKDMILPVEGRPNLNLLLSGPSSHRAADLIGPRLGELLDEFANEYDLVILDAPPLPGFAECLQMANAADGVLIVSRAGETKRKSVANVVTTLKRLRVNIIGIVLNQVTLNTSEYGYSYYGAQRYSRYRYRTPGADGPN
jgi:succinoglycan biosynthesis transport protein ExoP